MLVRKSDPKITKRLHRADRIPIVPTKGFTN